MDTGTAYGRAQGGYRSELTQVGAGTPMGELLRRYWHPVRLAIVADSGDPAGVRDEYVRFDAGNYLLQK